MNFYETYVRLCNSVNKSPSAVACEIGIEKSTVTRWSKGVNPNYSTLIKVANYFELPVEYLRANDIVILDDDTQVKLYQIFENAAEEKRISLDEAVHKAGLENNFLQRLKNSSYSRASNSSISKLANILDVESTVSNLIKEYSLPPILAGNLSSDEENVIFKIRSLMPERRKIIIDFITSPNIHEKLMILSSRQITDEELLLISSWRQATESERKSVSALFEKYGMRYQEEQRSTNAG